MIDSFLNYLPMLGDFIFVFPTAVVKLGDFRVLLQKRGVNIFIMDNIFCMYLVSLALTSSSLETSIT
jgi:hypothetical protein